MTGIVFPGQGTQSASMFRAQEAYDSSRRQETLSCASEIFGFDIVGFTENAAPEQLRDTRFAQPIIFTADMLGYYRLTEEEIYPDVVAGHSLGEYCALTAAGVISFEDACRLVKQRAEIMGRVRTNGILCVIKSTCAALGEIDEFIREISAGCCFPVQAALLNSPYQAVIALSRSDLPGLMEKAGQMKGISAAPLNVSRPFHSVYMEGMLDGFDEVLQNFTFRKPAIPVLSNAAGDYLDGSDSENIRKALLRQCCVPVQWVKIMEKMGAIRNIRVIECGPGHTLCGFFRNYNRAIPVFPIGDRKKMKRFREALNHVENV